MKILTVLANLSLAVAASCPYSQLKKAGLLNRAELAKYEELKRDRGHFEERSTNGLLALPLGGGLGRFFPLQYVEYY